MVKIISFEGCVGSGKTSLTNYFSSEFNFGKILEEYEKNPFLKEFYEEDMDINLETEITFLLIHYYQFKKLLEKSQNIEYIISDVSIEKDLVYARLNLTGNQLEIFENVYNFVIQKIGVPYFVIYLDLSLKIIKRRIFQRGRPYELSVDPEYFKEYNDKVKQYFKNHSECDTYFVNVDDLELDPDNPKLCNIRDKILEIV